jgi:hypothetical protein
MHIIVHHILWPIIVAMLLGQGRMYGRWEAPHMFYWRGISIARAQVFVQRREYLRVHHLEATNSVYHAFQMLEKKGSHNKKLNSDESNIFMIKEGSHNIVYSKNVHFKPAHRVIKAKVIKMFPLCFFFFK